MRQSESFDRRYKQVAQVALLSALVGGGAVLSGIDTLHSASPVWVLLTLMAVSAGIWLMSGARQAGGFLSAPQWMVLASALLMYAGLYADVAREQVISIAEICSATSLPSFDIWLRHIKAMPLMHAGMLAGGVAAILILRARARAGRACRRALCARAGFNTICSVVMLLGMFGGLAGFELIAGLTGWQWNGMAMLGGMVTGMVWAMWLLVLLYRRIFNWLDQVSAEAGKTYG
ncbi:MAG: hypothetical protein HY066_17190 [Betaproteobacteria bacterium]|nr:hypothetical protein [Betaproteobacteria bacterium]